MTTKGAISMHDLKVLLSAGDWVTRAACSPEIAEYFWPLPSQTNSAEIRTALKICSRCPVVRECGQWAIDNRQTDGVWGGMRPASLRRLVEKGRQAELTENPPERAPYKPLATSCGRGHPLRAPGQWPCQPCNQESKRRARQAARAVEVSS